MRCIAYALIGKLLPAADVAMELLVGKMLLLVVLVCLLAEIQILEAEEVVYPVAVGLASRSKRSIDDLSLEFIYDGGLEKFRSNLRATDFGDDFPIEVVDGEGVTSPYLLSTLGECSYYTGEYAAVENCQDGRYRGVVRLANGSAAVISPVEGDADERSHKLELISPPKEKIRYNIAIESLEIKFWGWDFRRAKRDTDGVPEDADDTVRGHFLGDSWSYKEVTARKSKRGEFVCNGPYCEYYKVKRDEPKWLELAVAADASVVDFHSGQNNNSTDLSMLRRYILTLMNVVSAVYADPTLGANLNFVVRRMVFFRDSSGGVSDPIREGDSKTSLGNVNKWNKAALATLPEDQRHDVAVWLTR